MPQPGKMPARVLEYLTSQGKWLLSTNVTTALFPGAAYTSPESLHIRNTLANLAAKGHIQKRRSHAPTGHRCYEYAVKEVAGAIVPPQEVLSVSRLAPADIDALAEAIVKSLLVQLKKSVE